MPKKVLVAGPRSAVHYHLSYPSNAFHSQKRIQTVKYRVGNAKCKIFRKLIAKPMIFFQNLTFSVAHMVHDHFLEEWTREPKVQIFQSLLMSEIHCIRDFLSLPSLNYDDWK